MRFIRKKKKPTVDTAYKTVSFEEKASEHAECPETVNPQEELQSEPEISEVETSAESSMGNQFTDDTIVMEAVDPNAETGIVNVAELQQEDFIKEEQLAETDLKESDEQQQETCAQIVPEPEIAAATIKEPYTEPAAYAQSSESYSESYENTAPATAADAAANMGKLKAFFGNRPITRKYIAVMVAAAVVLNSVLTAGMLAVFGHKDRKGMPDDTRNGRPDSEQLFDDNKSESEDSNAAPPQSSFPDREQYYDDDGDSDDYKYYPYDDDDWYSPYGSDNGSYRDDEGLFPEQGGQGQTPKSGQIQDPDQLYGQQNSSGAYIGIVISDDNGVYITQVNGDNARSAGFMTGDKVVSFEGTKISTSNDLISEVQKHNSGDEVTVTVERNGQQMDIKTKLQ